MGFYRGILGEKCKTNLVLGSRMVISLIWVILKRDMVAKIYEIRRKSHHFFCRNQPHVPLERSGSWI